LNSAAKIDKIFKRKSDVEIYLSLGVFTSDDSANFAALKTEKEPKAEMSFLQHLEELRWHLVRSSAAIFIFALIAFINKEFLFDKLILAPKNADFPTYRFLCMLGQKLNLDESICIKELSFTLINIDMSGQFSTHMSVSLYAGIVLAFPYVIWELWRFIKPGLHNHERKYANGIVFFTSLLFFLGVLFGYYVVTPMSVNFLGTYQVSSLVANQISLGSFISTVTTLTLMTGVVFELPILVYFLTKIGVLTPEFMRNYRRHAIVVLLIISAIITPPDVTSQILVCIPLLALYEISIFVSAYVLKKQEA
jgi:sec-independent protein translocase protein TatC